MIRDCALFGEPEPFAVELSVDDGTWKRRLLVPFEALEDFDPAFVIETGYLELERAAARLA